MSLATEDTVEITIGEEAPSAFAPEPLIPDRPDDYDPDLWWSEEDGDWVSVVTGGGNYNQYLVAISDDGNIFYG